MFSTCNQYGLANDDGFIQVQDQGNYLAEFGIDFIYQGTRLSFSSGILTPAPYLMNIPAQARDIYLNIMGYYDPSLSATIFYGHFDTPPMNCYILWGTPGNWGARQVPCDALTPNPGVTNPCCCNCCCNCSCNDYGNCYPNYCDNYYTGSCDTSYPNYYNNYYPNSCGNSYPSYYNNYYSNCY